MPPREDSALLLPTTSSYSDDGGGIINVKTTTDKSRPQRQSSPSSFGAILTSRFSFSRDDDDQNANSSAGNSNSNSNSSDPWQQRQQRLRRCRYAFAGLVMTGAVALLACTLRRQSKLHRTGPYKLVEHHYGASFFDHYTFYDGADSLGSAGFQTYVSKKRAVENGLVRADGRRSQEEGGGGDGSSSESFYIGSAPGVGSHQEGGSSSSSSGSMMRESVRLEGKIRYSSGLFVFDVDAMPAGCGVWPALWLTDETAWPRNGEIDVVEGVNLQSRVKTAMHTSEHCDMYGYVSRANFTGSWDRATGLPELAANGSGAVVVKDFETNVPADNCWVNAPHQWANQGCVAVHDENGTIGQQVNDAGGAVYVLDWDPSKGHIRSWAFRKDQHVPGNLQRALDHPQDHEAEPIDPDSDDWGMPYAYFAVGENTGCSSDHFKNMRLVLNTAFCGTVAGNRFLKDCPALGKQFAVYNKTLDGGIDPIATCEAYVASNPQAIQEQSHWKIRGISVHQRA